MTFGTESISKGRKRMMEHKKSLLEEMPELAAQWHPARNGDLTPDQVSPSSCKKVWWQLGYDDERTGKHFDFEWQEKIRARAILGYGCPYLSGQQVWSGFNDLSTLYPDVAREWHPTKNGDLTPSQVTAKNNQVVWWYLPFDDPCTGKHHDFEWKTRIDCRTVHVKGEMHKVSVSVYLNNLQVQFVQGTRGRKGSFSEALVLDAPEGSIIA